MKELNNIIHQDPQEDTVKNFEIDALANHIVEIHHSYIRNKIPEIEPFLDKIIRVHGKTHPELKKVQKKFQAIKEELLNHMQKEENILFPYIKEMMRAKKNNAQLIPPFFETIKNPINMMKIEHESASDSFKEIEKITNDLTPPKDACNTYRVLFSLLNEFEDDLHKHIHLENNVLFPKAIVLEEDLFYIPIKSNLFKS